MLVDDYLAASLATPEPDYDLIVCVKADRLSGDQFVLLDRERVAAHHCVSTAYATEPWDPALEMLTEARALAALIRRRVLGSSYFTIGSCYTIGRGM
ncbi:hypothetical protein [Saccharopolyspora sp. 5N708]|uniref:hypothetical protein n=1 Tax=Saccharopolyspora sp. 5N708 TaxID=3457424 RepID=UPI003FCF6725